MGGWLNFRNIVAGALAPATGGLSLLAAEKPNGDSVWGDITGANSAKAANEKNIQLQKETNQMSIDLANSAHQREVEDLKAAGLNPILSAGGNGATTPALGTAQVQNEMPGGYLAQAQGAVGIIGGLAQAQNAVSTANQANTQANLNNVNAKIQPELAKAKIASDFANAGSAKATADYTKTMKDVDKALKESETDLNIANTYRTKNVSKGEQSRLWTQAITGGMLNVAGASTGTIGAVNSARNMMSHTPIGFKY